MAPKLGDALAGPPADSVADVVARLRAVQEALPAANGVAHFNRLYLAVTEEVESELAGGAYLDAVFVERLDVLFAGLYLDALAVAFRDGGPPPRAWRPLFECAERRGIAPLQFALAGMNAHVNRDLPVALVETWRALGRAPRRGGPEHGDFLRVNGQLARVSDRVKHAYLGGALGFLDRALGRVDDVVATWNVARARDAAWTNGETLWRLRDAPGAAAEFVTALDGTVGLAGRGLLVPAHRIPLPRRLRAERFLRLVGRF